MAAVLDPRRACDADRMVKHDPMLKDQSPWGCRGAADVEVTLHGKSYRLCSECADLLAADGVMATGNTVCAVCGAIIAVSDIPTWSRLEQREYQITRMCLGCQRQAFPECYSS